MARKKKRKEYQFSCSCEVTGVWRGLVVAASLAEARRKAEEEIALDDFVPLGEINLLPLEEIKVKEMEKMTNPVKEQYDIAVKAINISKELLECAEKQMAIAQRMAINAVHIHADCNRWILRFNNRILITEYHMVTHDWVIYEYGRVICRYKPHYPYGRRMQEYMNEIRLAIALGHI